MRTAAEVLEFARQTENRYVHTCEKCHGADTKCSCYRRYRIAVAAYEACVPRDFWNIKPEDVTNNREVFTNVVWKYAKQLNKALKKGYGLVFLGDNGVGKTYFMSYVLMEAIKKGRTAFYTTAPQLDYDIKRAFNDPVAQDRIRWLLTSDFLAIDEMGKEKFKKDTTYTDTQVERILKQRCDDSMPVLMATNMDYNMLLSAYGPTIGSIISGKFQTVTMEPGDHRAKLASQMETDMGYEL